MNLYSDIPMLIEEIALMMLSHLSVAWKGHIKKFLMSFIVVFSLTKSVYIALSDATKYSIPNCLVNHGMITLKRYAYSTNS